MIAEVPYDAEVEYLVADGNEYIETDIVPQNGDSLECEIYLQPFLGSGSRYRCVCSAGTGTYQFVLLPDTYSTSAKIFFKYFATGTSANTTYDLSRWLRIAWEGDGTLNVNGVVRWSNYQAPLDGDDTNLWLLRRRNGTQGFVGRIKSFRYYVGGNLVLDLVPVRIGTVGYLYNRVTRRIMKTSGNYAFAPGPDVATPVMGIHRYAPPRVVLPEGLRRLAYLESDGTQYIDTGVLIGPDLRIESQIESFVDGRYAYGCLMTSYKITCNQLSSGRGWARWGSGAVAKCLPAYRCTVVQDASGVKVDGVHHDYDKANIVRRKNGITLYLFTARDAEGGVSPDGLVGRVYYQKIYDNGVLVRDFIPVAKGDVGYMYDAVNNVLYPNLGSGAFVLGEIGGAA